MGNRLTKLYTKTGDDGTTGLGDGSRTTKDSSRIEAVGTIDELNSWIGLLLAELPEDEPLIEPLTEIQHRLFDLGGELAVPGFQLIQSQMVSDLEVLCDQLNEELPPLKEFILPGGSTSAGLCHMARAVARRAERVIVTLSKDESIGDDLKRYINRLSDVLFVMARRLARRDGGHEVFWKSKRTQ
ncbi:MAG: cob(I)yrinic acid a,c-diamide adenosyltransferase [Oceanospirillales bacterium TMED33]|nr:ATP:cob(I)alamin adenosyltransferase [Gammaproteobacteria bacterium]RPG21732.1 MAG: cob(I)yrinic acid a,c-diamide adenosyltransferase [Oceanospirillales bacterium TMED33]